MTSRRDVIRLLQCGLMSCGLMILQTLLLRTSTAAPLKGLQTNGRYVAFPASIRLGCKWMEGANTAAYYNATTMTTVKLCRRGP
jgi:hypothetical protein